MAQILHSSAPQQHHDRDKPPSIPFDGYSDGSRLPETLLTTGRHIDSFHPVPATPDTFQQHSKNRSQSCHPRFHSTAILTQPPKITPVDYAAATVNKISQKRTQQWLSKYEVADGWECMMADKTVVVVEDVEISSDEDELHAISQGSSTKNGRVPTSDTQECARGRRPSISPASLRSKSSSETESVDGDGDLKPRSFENPFGTYRGSGYESQTASAQLSPFHPLVTQIRQNSSAGCSTLVDADGLDDSNSTRLPSMWDSEEDAWTSRHSAELSGNAGLQGSGRPVRRSLSVPRPIRNPQNEKYTASSWSTVRSHSRYHQTTRFPIYGPRHTQRQHIVLSKEPLPVFDIYNDGIKQLSELLERGAITSTGILDVYLRQIDKHNDTLRALVHLAPREDVYRLARQRDLERKLGRCRGPLHGIPLVIKDNIATEESMGMPTTAGSFALMGMPVKKDSFIVTKLRDAGAIIIAKANMSELADYKSRHAGPGWSAVGGQTLNVYAAHASPGTSSAGNGVAVAAGFCPASIGTETGSSYGENRMGSGPPDGCYAWQRSRRFDYVAQPSFKGLRIGVPRENWHNIDPWKRPGRDLISTEISDAFELALSTMSGLGATITDPADIPSVVDGSLWRCVEGSRSLVVAADCKEYLGEYLQNLGGEGGCRSVEDIIAFNARHSDIEMPPGHHGQEVLERTLLAKSVESSEYLGAKEDMVATAGTRGLDAVFEKYNLDAIFMIREGHHSLANMVGYPIGKSLQSQLGGNIALIPL
ncbi:hypothetical protein QFC21_005417 [Naganishia friedmannii]|uniref:Uncharacterized protein n=1 Tax=Naganishia friedmannii TaxID=89922 RepID=A0ACC2V9T5_9TREE|nr:hypothetical protein QFC21_005417 [Naganishia friedmannii]